MSELRDVDSVLLGDVIVWANSERILVHTCYSLGDGYAFNKDGQSMFNPWNFCNLDNVIRNWNSVLEKGGSVCVYRR
jgi:hypothetical protein